MVFDAPFTVAVAVWIRALEPLVAVWVLPPVAGVGTVGCCAQAATARVNNRTSIRGKAYLRNFICCVLLCIVEWSVIDSVLTILLGTVTVMGKFTQFYSKPSARAPVIHPGDEALFLVGGGEGSLRRAATDMCREESLKALVSSKRMRMPCETGLEPGSRGGS
jgi:hypothetical protein